MDSPQRKISTSSKRLFKIVIVGFLTFCLAIGITKWLSQPAAHLGRPIPMKEQPPDEPIDPLYPIFADRQQLYVGHLPTEYLSRTEALEKDFANLDDAVNQTERRRCDADSHLRQALGSPDITPFTSSKSQTSKMKNAAGAALIPLFIEDYRQNSSDPQTLKDQLIPRVKRCLEGLWVSGRGDWVQEVRELETEKSDPLVYYCEVLDRQSTYEDLQQAAIKGQEALKRRKSGALLRFQLVTKVLRYSANLDEKALVAASIEAVEAAADLFQHHQSDSAMLQFVFPNVVELFDNLGGRGKLQLANTLASRSNPPCPNWILHYAAARICGSIADQYRGEQAISEVRPEDLKGFEDFSEKQAKHLLRSWTLNPDTVEIPIELLTVETRAGSTGRSVDSWFRHGMSVQADDPRLIGRYTTHCEPRWGGSDEKLFWLANRLADCVGMDSDLPFTYWWPLNQYLADYCYCADMAEPAPLEATLEILQFLKSRTGPRPDPRIFGDRTASLVRVLWDARRLTDLKWFLDRYRETIGSGDLIVHRLDLAFVESVCHAAQGAGIESWSIICEDLLAETHNLTEEKFLALEIALAEARALATDANSKRAIETCERLFGWVKSFREGKPTELDFANNATGWLTNATLKIIDEHTVEIASASADNTFFLAPMIRIPTHHRFQAELSATKGSDIYGIALQEGPHAARAMHYNGIELRMSTGRQALIWDNHPQNYGTRVLKAANATGFDATSTFAIEMAGNNAKGFIDNKEFAETNASFVTGGIVQISRATRYEAPWNPHLDPVEYRISNVRVARLITDSGRSKPKVQKQ